jgi:hypothetical protein
LREKSRGLFIQELIGFRVFYNNVDFIKNPFQNNFLFSVCIYVFTHQKILSSVARMRVGLWR